MNLIGIAGRMGHGKDTVAEIIRELTPGMNWEIKKFAGKLKQIASILTGIPAEDFEKPEVKNNPLPDEWSIWKEEIEVAPGARCAYQRTGRMFLQKLGTDAIRENVHPNAWVNALFAGYQKQTSIGLGGPDIYTVKFPNWLITDVRFPNETQAIKDRGGIVIRVKRPFVLSDTEHISETALDDWKFDFTIDNSGSLADLKASVAAILRHYRIGQYGDGFEVRG